MIEVDEEAHMGAQTAAASVSSHASARDWYPVLGMGWLVAQVVAILTNLLAWGFEGPPSLVGIVGSCLSVLVWIAAAWLLGRRQARSFLLVSAGYWALIALSGSVAAFAALGAGVPLWLAQAVGIGLLCPLHGFSLIPGGLTPLSLGAVGVASLAWLTGCLAARRAGLAE